MHHQQRFVWSKGGKILAAMFVNHAKCEPTLGVDLKAVPNVRARMTALNEHGAYPYKEIEPALANSARFKVHREYIGTPSGGICTLS